MINLPTPDKQQVRMLNPPPTPKIVKELYNQKIFTYLTEAKKKQYEQILTEKDLTWSHAGREAFKMYFEGKPQDTDKYDEFAKEVLKLLRHRPTPIIHKDIEDDSEYTEARKKAKKKDLIKAVAQSDDHKGFINVCVPELKEKFKNLHFDGDITKEELKKKLDEMGLETVPFDVQMQPKPKADDLGFKTFLKDAEANKQEFADCKWKQQAEEVVV